MSNGRCGLYDAGQGDSLTKPQLKVTSAEVVIICPEVFERVEKSSAIRGQTSRGNSRYARLRIAVFFLHLHPPKTNMYTQK